MNGDSIRCGAVPLRAGHSHVNRLRDDVREAEEIKRAFMRHHGHIAAGGESRDHDLLTRRRRVFGEPIETVADPCEAAILSVMGEEGFAEATLCRLGRSEVASLLGSDLKEAVSIWSGFHPVMHKSNNT